MPSRDALPGHDIVCPSCGAVAYEIVQHIPSGGILSAGAFRFPDGSGPRPRDRIGCSVCLVHAYGIETDANGGGILKTHWVRNAE